MFDLEKTITEWRRQMLAAGIRPPALVEELEGHLREEIEQLIKTGMDASLAFEIATGHIGQPRLLKHEFKKIERNSMKRVIIIALGVFASLTGPALILPALAKHKNMGIWSYDIAWLIILGAIIALAGMGMVILGFKKQKA
ncbi:MAG TPA: hypothetical protein VGO57_10280 [Verrucomicrobiae bacterium]|jgi:hypothetical protein